MGVGKKAAGEECRERERKQAGQPSAQCKPSREEEAEAMFTQAISPQYPPVVWQPSTAPKQAKAWGLRNVAYV